MAEEGKAQKRMLDAALYYASLGIAVFPLHTPQADGTCSCNRPSCSDVGKHPRTAHGVNQATRDPDVIRRLWGRWPDAGVGAATGEISGIVVLDADDGELGLEEVVAHYGSADAMRVPRVRTGAGTHFYYRHPGWRVGNRVKNTGGWPAKHCDLRGDGGYVILPPSLHANGNRYAWLDNHDPSEFPPMPAWLIADAKAVKQPKQPPDSAPTAGRAEIPEEVWRASAEQALEKYTKLALEEDNPRNETGFALACQLRDAGVPRAEALAYMRSFQRLVEDAVSGKAPYTWEEAAKSHGSAYDAVDKDGNPVVRNPAFSSARKGRNRPPGVGIGLWSTQLFVDGCGQDLRYVAVHNRWYIWNGLWWDYDKKKGVVLLAEMTVKSLYASLSTMDDTERKAILPMIAKLDSATGVKSMIELATPCPPIAALPDEFDRDRLSVVAANGEIDLRTGELTPNLREHMNTRRVGPSLGESPYAIPYEPTALCPNWLAFLDLVLEHRQEDIDFLQRAFGYTLTGWTIEHAWFLLTGDGSNGKSTVTRVLHDILGTYAAEVPIESLLVNQNESIPAEIAKLDGARCAITGENEQGKRLAEALIKRITGGDNISARFLYGQPFTFSPQFKLWMHTNYKPRIRGQDLGTWRRIKPIPFNHTIPPDQADKLFYEHMLEPELPGILAWAVQGAMDYIRTRSLGEPAAIMEAVRNYRSESDITRQYLEDNILQDDKVYVTCKDLYDHYTRWSKQHGEKADTSIMFGRRVVDRYNIESEVRRVQGANQRVYVGLRVNDNETEYGRA